MAQVINTNTMSLTTQRNLTTNSASLATSIQRLSSGLRINSAKDDAAGLAISQRMTTQIRGMDQAARNANDGISLAQTAEGALGSIGENLQRIRELAVQAANGTNESADQESIQKEITALTSEITRVVGNTTFNGKSLFTSGAADIKIQVGAGASDADSITITGMNLATSGALSGVSAISVSGITAGSGADVLDDIDSMINQVNSARADLGAVQNRFTSVITNLQTNSENLSASRSRIQDTDYAKETAELTRTQILQQAGTAMLAQAKSVPQNVLSLLQ